MYTACILLVCVVLAPATVPLVLVVTGLWWLAQRKSRF